MNHSTEVLYPLLILLCAVWTTAIALRFLGIPTILGELLAGVILGPSMLNLFAPNEIINALAEIGIFFLMLHAGIKTDPKDFFKYFKKAFPIAVGGALVPLILCFLLGILFGLTIKSALVIGLSMSATAIVVSLKIFKDLKLGKTKLIHIILGTSVFDAGFTLVLMTIVFSLFRNDFSAISIFMILLRLAGFFVGIILFGNYIFPHFVHIFKSRNKKAFTFLIILALFFSLFAEQMGLSFMLGAFFAGVFFHEQIADKQNFQKIEDRVFSVAFSFLGPLFFVSLGFHFDFSVFYDFKDVTFLVALIFMATFSKIVGAGIMARYFCKFSIYESTAIGIAMNGRAEIAFAVALLALNNEFMSKEAFSALIGTIFFLNLITPLLLKWCILIIKKRGEFYRLKEA